MPRLDHSCGRQSALLDTGGCAPIRVAQRPSGNAPKLTLAAGPLVDRLGADIVVASVKWGV